MHEHRCELWPGYDTSIRQHKYDILLNCDVVHKVMRTDTVYREMIRIQERNPAEFTRNFQQQIIGKTVLTDYNNRTYRIDDVDFEKTPASTFDMRGQQISFTQYFAQKYELVIRDQGQPLLVVNPSERDRRGGRDQQILLVPELCRFTGLDERQRTDIR